MRIHVYLHVDRVGDKPVEQCRCLRPTSATSFVFYPKDTTKLRDAEAPVPLTFKAPLVLRASSERKFTDEKVKKIIAALAIWISADGNWREKGSQLFAAF